MAAAYNMAGHYLLRIVIESRSRAEFPYNWPEAETNVLVTLHKDDALFNQLSRNKKVVHLTQLNLATGEILLYSSTQ